MIRFIRPTLPEPEAWLPYLRSSYAQRVFSNSGPAAIRLEAALAERYAGPDREVILVANCTAGITAALLALGASGRVVVPAFTFPATAQAVLQAGCQPVFCDVSPQTWEMDPGALEQVLARYPAAAVVHVRAFGFCRDVEAIEAVSAQYSASLIVDGAAALGGRLKTGEWAGQQGEAEVFSMHATKVFGIGEGGVVFASRRHAARLRQACNFGLVGGDVAMRGLNGKLSDFHAAIGLALLDRIDEYVGHRREVAMRYDLAFASSAWATRAEEVGASPMQTYPLLIESAILAEQLVERCLQRGVELRRYYRPALHEASIFASCERGHVAVSEDLASRMVCLPVYSDMTAAEIDVVIDSVLRSV